MHVQRNRSFKKAMSVSSSFWAARSTAGFLRQAIAKQVIFLRWRSSALSPPHRRQSCPVQNIRSHETFPAALDGMTPGTRSPLKSITKKCVSSNVHCAWKQKIRPMPKADFNMLHRQRFILLTVRNIGDVFEKIILHI